MNNMRELTDEEYKNVLEYYKMPIPKSKRILKNTTEKTLAKKLCRCIKKINTKFNPEPRAIGICTKSIFNRKGLTRGTFKCIGNKKVIFGKTIKKKIIKNKNTKKTNNTRKNIKKTKK